MAMSLKPLESLLSPVVANSSSGALLAHSLIVVLCTPDITCDEQIVRRDIGIDETSYQLLDQGKCP